MSLDQNKSSETGSHYNQLARMLLAIILLTFVILAGAGWGLYRHFQLELIERIENIDTERLKGELYRTDEVLAMSARAFVLSQDQKWQQRYEDHALKFRNIVKEMVAIADVSGKKLEGHVMELNDQLIAIEREAMRNSEEGKLQEAREALFSEKYEKMRQDLRNIVLQLAKPSRSGTLLEHFKEKMLYLDEVMTMSAYMAAYTQDPQWEKRYWSHYDEALKIFHELQFLAPGVHAAYGSKIFEEAITELLVLEKQVFELVKNGELKAAQEIFDSANYRKYKDLYLQGAAQFSEIISQNAREFIEQERRAVVRHVIIIGLLVVLLVAVWVIIWRIFRRWQEAIIFKNMELNDLNRTLDDKVKARTQELEKQRQDLELANKDLMKNEEALRAMYKDIKKIHEDYKQTQVQLIQSEKLASIGQLAAGVAHEINNPIGFISGNIQTMEQYIGGIKRLLDKVHELKQAIDAGAPQEPQRLKGELENLEEELNIKFIADDMVELIKESQNGIERIKRIVMDLKTFARKDADETSLINVQDVLEEVLNILWNELKYTCKVEREYSPVPLVKCNAQKLGQVFMNILLNAKQAIKDKGTITVRTYKLANEVCIDITDTGPGIPKEIINKIFDPFFTTKPVGLGTGLGLSISVDILKSCQGSLKVESEPGRGSTFTVVLPIKH